METKVFRWCGFIDRDCNCGSILNVRIYRRFGIFFFVRRTAKFTKNVYATIVTDDIRILKKYILFPSARDVCVYVARYKKDLHKYEHVFRSNEKLTLLPQTFGEIVSPPEIYYIICKRVFGRLVYLYKVFLYNLYG